MKIIVCIKQIGYIYHPLAIESAGSDIDPEKVVHMLNPFDEVSVEAALRIKQDFPESEIVLITVGTAKADEALRYAFAMGGDKMIRVHSDTTDPGNISRNLANAILHQGFDMILCGKKAMDTNDNLVHSFIAEALGIPQVSGIVGLQPYPDDGRVILERYLGRGDREVVECPMPALFTVEKGMCDPRYPSLINRRKAEKTEIEVLDPDLFEGGFEGMIEFGGVYTLIPPRPRPKKVFTPEASLSPIERLQIIMSGGAAEKKGDLFKGKPDDMATKILEIMVQEKIIE